MNLSQFYTILDTELSEIIEENKELPEIKRHKNIDQKKGYASLFWFLDFYGQKPLFKSFITEGSSDSSCDIIFSNKNYQGESIFYVIQSKWKGINKKGNIPTIDTKEFGKTLADFTSILKGTAEKGKNENFNRKYEELILHLENNGKVKFIFYTLASYNDEISSAVDAFRKNFQPNIELEIITIEQIRRDYIEFRFKEIKTSNPLEYQYDAEEHTMELEIERFSDNHRDIFEFQGRTKSYILLLRPKTVFELFEKYQFSLFYKNVRNPLHESNYNKNIVNTLNKKPDAFWYFNNGVTAITELIPDIGQLAKKITIHGLQIINGAQTIYSVYQAYLNASEKDRKKMDTDARIMLRLIRSSDEELNTQITKYTNMQNPMYNRDFFANDDVQIRLQNASFETNYWYEKRRGEFRIENKDNNLGVQVVPNEFITLAYVAFHQQKPVNAIINPEKFFVSKKEDADGLYEDIFNENISYLDMLASFFIFKMLIDVFGEEDEDNIRIPEPVLDFLMPSLALSKTIITKYLLKKLNPEKELNITKYIIDAFEKENANNIGIFFKCIMYSLDYIQNKIGQGKTKEGQENFTQLMTNPIYYETIKVEVEKMDLDLEKIDKIKLNKQEVLDSIPAESEKQD